MAKRLKKKVKKFIILLIVLCLGIYGYIGYKKFNHNKEPINIKEVIAPKDKWPKVSNASLVATGDALLHTTVYVDGYNKETDTFNFSKQLTMVKDIISSYDIAYYNQETIFGGKQTTRFKDNVANILGYYGGGGSDNGGLYFNSPSEFGDAMMDIGFNTVSLATNHSADCTYLSKDCLTNAYNYWSSKNIVFDGFNENEQMENNYNIGSANGITYGILNYTNTLNGNDRFVNDFSYLIDIYDEEKVANEVKDLKEKVDVVIVAMHWHKSSAEYSFVPTEANKDIAKYLNSLGVDIILGTYSHCVQSFDIIGDEHKTYVFYSLGNFISNQQDLNLYNYHPYVGVIGMLASLNITKTEYEDGTKNIDIDNIGIDLLYTYNKNHKDYLVVPFSKMTSDYNKDYEKLYEEYKGYVTSLNNSVTVAPIGSKIKTD